MLDLVYTQVKFSLVSSQVSTKVMLIKNNCQISSYERNRVTERLNKNNLYKRMFF